MPSNDPTAPRGGSSRRSELKRSYKENPPDMGVFAVRNLTNGRVFVCSSVNLKGMLNRVRFSLDLGGFLECPALQADWKRLGAAQFAFEVLDSISYPEKPEVDPKEELEVLEAMWLERLQPYGDAGYNTPPKDSAGG